ncbi:hypothetical protein GLOIN_2v1878683 [Rhizophagus irregularis DAOM 181602=DAOM 197198]|uniref:Galactose oxidase n=1 Tax=Rhizophagus irregularis (strain DAOM 181602 / DAOM 197198 / MUCL 43194) TaxID=747089 RepID=A0A2P4PRK8_RHIID|nr:hypothetical protein GLOIN_2v1878683 [Rhizophagus irregularis DAOM 181602=DAOM 197198]POG67990.1 hypothetical protein GLOIN_2v1878683 [Rhizophagus irregularis DAOM 181602=DAOM 197198]CAG8603872.1 21987_t:CDS:2 [Rhizophagus irregularis]|eukprot:XP_025174856.1 hypothetical protein GLOIN_2v1878683 [Rhizophagus irregularis DAOM 181602=DAOM 197198]
MHLSKLIISMVLRILNHIILANCAIIFGGDGYSSLLAGDKLYYFNYIGNFFYVDLTDVSLDTNTVIDRTKWIDLTVIRPQPTNSISRYPLLSGKDNDKIFFFNTDDNFRISVFDTKLNKWETIDQDSKVFLKRMQIPNFWSVSSEWVSDKKIGKSYTFQSISAGLSIFDSVNLELTQNTSSPKNLFGEFASSYTDFAQVLLPNGQILFIGGKIDNKAQSMDNILIYNTITNTWQITNTVGEMPGERTKHTAVLTTDGRIIVFGGVSNLLPASPDLSVLDISKSPYEWSTPTVENPFGSLILGGHTSIMVKNFMVSAFGINASESSEPITEIFTTSENKNVYKLDVSDPLKYKWSLFIKNDADTPTPTGSNPITTNISDSVFALKLPGVSLDTDTIIDKSKWVDLTEIKPQPGIDSNIPLLSKDNEKLIILDNTDDDVNAYTFHTTSNQWEVNPTKVIKKKEFVGLGEWVSDENTGISYSFLDSTMSIFDSINLTLTKGVSTPENLSADIRIFEDSAQVLLNGQILFIGGGFSSFKNPMSSILMYNTRTDTWQMMNTVGETPEGRIKHTAVSTSDGRIIVFGGISNSLPASPQLSILDTSKTPYEWSTPMIENPFTLSDHAAVMVNNYMIVAFGINTRETIPTLIDNNNIYKLDIRDPLKYKWSFLSGFDSSDNFDSSLDVFKPTNSTPIKASVDSASRLGTPRQYRRKIKNKMNTYHQNISNNENISINEELEKSMT